VLVLRLKSALLIGCICSKCTVAASGGTTRAGVHSASALLSQDHPRMTVYMRRDDVFEKRFFPSANNFQNRGVNSAGHSAHSILKREFF
jgi:hypothetical protein